MGKDGACVLLIQRRQEQHRREMRAHLSRILWLAALMVDLHYAANPNWIHFKGFNYSLVHEEMSWEESRTNCIEKGSHLVVITSDEVTDFIMNEIGKNDKHHWWIGLNAFKKEGAKWVDGTPLVYDNFHPGQPTGESFEGCTEMFTPHNGEWHDRRCTALGRSICQRIDLCGHTCWDVVGNRGESCSCT